MAQLANSSVETSNGSLVFFIGGILCEFVVQCLLFGGGFLFLSDHLDLLDGLVAGRELRL